ncbi:MAG: hypothetical protein JJU37_13195 [Balneolaceae bacterium]|nr:hypothetical protein [Balneolaceae bacterium]
MKNLSFILAVLGFFIGSMLNLQTAFLSSDQEINVLESHYTLENVRCEGAGCSNMFSSSDNCNESAASCCEGGTGYNLSCSIRCDSGSSINCGASTDPEVHASLIETTCITEYH